MMGCTRCIWVQQERTLLLASTRKKWHTTESDVGYGRTSIKQEYTATASDSGVKRYQLVTLTTDHFNSFAHMFTLRHNWLTTGSHAHTFPFGASRTRRVPRQSSRVLCMECTLQSFRRFAGAGHLCRAWSATCPTGSLERLLPPGGVSGLAWPLLAR